MTTQTQTQTNAIDALPDGDPRSDPRLDDPAFVGTEEGQALVAAAADADKEARKLARAAAAKAAKAKAEGSGPVKIVKQPTNGKPTAAARAAAGKGKTTRAKAKADPLAAPRPKRAPTNAELKLGTEPVIVKGTPQYPILGKDGTPLERYQTDNWAWSCSGCHRRVRTAYCVGPKDGPAHKKVAAPHGYMRDSRIVKEG